MLVRAETTRAKAQAPQTQNMVDGEEKGFLNTVQADLLHTKEDLKTEKIKLKRVEASFRQYKASVSHLQCPASLVRRCNASQKRHPELEEQIQAAGGVQEQKAGGCLLIYPSV